MATMTQTSSHSRDPTGASFETLKLNLALLKNPHWDRTQGSLTEVLETVGAGEAGDGLKLQGSPLCRMSGTCFPSKASVCKAFSSGQTPRTGLFYQICPGIEEFTI